MIIVLKPLSPKEDIERVENMVKARGLDTHVSTQNSSKLILLSQRLCMCRSLTN